MEMQCVGTPYLICRWGWLGVACTAAAATYGACASSLPAMTSSSPPVVPCLPRSHTLAPSWKERPEDILEVLRWAREHDDEARRIAHNGQMLALK